MVSPLAIVHATTMSAAQPPRPRNRRRYAARVAEISTVKPLFQPKRTHPATRALTWVCSGVGSRRKRKALRILMQPCYLWSMQNASDIRHASNGVRNLHAAYRLHHQALAARLHYGYLSYLGPQVDTKQNMLYHCGNGEVTH